MLRSVNAPDVKEKRKFWNETISNYDVNKLVFLDESAVNTDMTRIYGRAVGKKRVVDKTPLNTPTSTTILSSMRINGRTAYTTYQGGTTGDKFLDYLKNILFPTLEKGDILVMDNLRTHHMNAVADAAREAGIILLYLPPYSPDYNPIEKMWSKIKSILRTLKVRNIADLPKAIEYAFNEILDSDCKGWFASSMPSH